METDNAFDCCFDDEASVENAIMNGGVSFEGVKYVGCIEILTPMKAMDFASRSLVAKECIHRVCEAANMKSPSKKRRVEKRVSSCISNPCLEHSGETVLLNISSRCLELISSETNEVVARHDMPNVSFASGGDSSSTNMVAYVAKDGMEWRACYVLDLCTTDKAQTVISTIGQAFELRYKTFCCDDVGKRNAIRRKNSPLDDVKCDSEYYNDLPGKVPPEMSDGSSNTYDKRRDRLHSNLIDLNTSIDYVNEDNNSVAGTTSRDTVFDMQCFSLAPEVQLSQLLLENWYHGPISRVVSESLLKADGDFLVRDSQGSTTQFVLTGLNAGQPKHLLLIGKQWLLFKHMKNIRDRSF